MTKKCIDYISLLELAKKNIQEKDYETVLIRHLINCDKCLDDIIEINKTLKNFSKNEQPTSIKYIEKIFGKPKITTKIDNPIDYVKLYKENLNKKDNKKIEVGQIWSTNYINDIDNIEFYTLNPAYVLILSEPKKIADFEFIEIMILRDRKIDLNLKKYMSFDDLYLERLPFLFETWLNFTITTDTLKKYYTSLKNDELEEIQDFLEGKNDLKNFKTGKNKINKKYQEEELDSVIYLDEKVEYIFEKYINIPIYEEKIIDFGENLMEKPLELVANSDNINFYNFKVLEELFNKNKYNILIEKSKVLYDLFDKDKQKQIIEILNNLLDYLKKEDELDEVKKTSINILKELKVKI